MKVPNQFRFKQANLVSTISFLPKILKSVKIDILNILKLKPEKMSKSNISDSQNWDESNFSPSTNQLLRQIQQKY